MECWQPLGRPVVPLVYMRKTGASAGNCTGSTRWPRDVASSSLMTTPRPCASLVGLEYLPG